MAYRDAVRDRERSTPRPPAGLRSIATGLLEESFRDLADDFDELAHIVGSAESRLGRALEELEACRAHLQPATRELVASELLRIRSRYAGYRRDLFALRDPASTARPSLELLARLARWKRSLADLVRSQQGIVGSLVTATDWQSPSFLHAVHSQAGRHTGRVTEHHDDYKRDRHADAAEFECTFLRECVDNPRGLQLRALITACGMAAFTTILGYLEMEGKLERPVLVGMSLYHECKQLLAHSRAADRLVWLDECNIEAIDRAVAEHRPGAIFLDSLCNADGIAVPDLQGLIPRLARRAVEETFLVIDNTGLSVALQPFALLPRRSPLRLVVFESLTKYAQLGLDRTPAGIILAEGAGTADALSGYREHLGTNIADACVHAIPVPDRAVYERRLARLERNAMLLAQGLAARVSTVGRSVVEGVSYPGLPGHPSFEVARRLPFRGGFFAVDIAPREDRMELQRRFVTTALDEARAVRVPLAAGASFGLNTTRVYHTASTSAHGRPFIRVSAGTEHRLGVEAVLRVLTRAIGRLSLGCQR